MTRTTGDVRDPRLNDTLRSSGGLHEAGRLRRAIAEFLSIPFVVTAACCLLAVGVSILDVMGGGGPLHRAALLPIPAARARLHRNRIRSRKQASRRVSLLLPAATPDSVKSCGSGDTTRPLLRNIQPPL